MSDPLGDKVKELRLTLVALIADGLAARPDADRFPITWHADASDLLARYLTNWHSWWEMSNRQARPPCPMHACDGSAHDHGNSNPLGGTA